MEILLAIAVAVVIGALIYFNRSSKGLDVNNDGKVDLEDVKAAVDNAVVGVTAAVDVNKDGKVDAADVKEVAKKATTGAKKAATKAKTAVKKATTRGRKPKAQ
jgi:Ca2+-binding EF-hand superfamily protein